MNSQSTEPEKAEFHTPAIPNMVRDCVKENSLENISPDPVQLTLPRLDNLPRAPFDSKSEDSEEITEPLCTCHDLKEILWVPKFLLYLSNMLSTIGGKELRFYT